MRSYFALLVLLLAAAVLWLAVAESPERVDGTAWGTVDAEAVAAAERAEGAGSAARTRVDATTQAPPAAHAPAGAGEPGTNAHLHGRCVDAEDGQPVAGVRATLHGYPASDARVAAYPEPLRWRDPEPVTTGADGRFAFTFVPEEPNAYRLEVGAEGRSQQQRNWSSLRSGEIVDAGDLKVHRVTAAVLFVSDQHRTPREGIRVTAYAEAEDGSNPWRGKLLFSAVSGPDGLVRFSPGLPAGKHWIEAFYEQAGTWLTVQAGVPARGELVLPRKPVLLAGMVVDTQGQPVPGLRVGTAEPGKPPIASATSAPDGSFVLHGEAAADAQLQLHADRVWGDANQGGRRYAPGSTGIRFVVVALGQIAVTVVDAESGRPIDRYAAGVFDPEGRNHRAGPSPGGHHPRGRARIDGFPPGIWNVVVLPGSDRWARSGPHEVRVAGGETAELQVKLARSRGLRVRVTHAGQCVRGAIVELIECPPDHRLHLSDAYEPLRPQWNRPPAEQSLLLRGVATGGDGSAALRVPPGAGFWLRVRAEGYRPQLLALPAEPGEELTIELLRGAALQVQCTPAGAVAEQLALRDALLSYGAMLFQSEPRLQLQRIGELGNSRSLAVAQDLMAVDGLDPGEWSVALSLPWVAAFENGEQKPACRQQVVLAGSEVARVTLDLTPLRPGSAEVTLLRPDGTVLTECAVRVRSAGMSGSRDAASRLQMLGLVQLQDLRTDSTGRLPRLLLPPGSYSVQAPGTALGDRGDRITDAEGTFHVVAGGVTASILRFNERRLLLTLQWPDGKPAARARAGVVMRGSAERVLQTDAHGQLWIGGVQDGEIQVELRREQNPELAWGVESEVARAVFNVPGAAGLHRITSALR